MFVIQALHSAGWVDQGTAQLEYWAQQEAQMRCCSDGRTYRILSGDDRQLVALITTSGCRIDRQRLKAALS
ncbi:hypothetical protein NZK33_19110 [Cyanobium sp. FGCU-6]|nr:hypothetical protein [Cyanobium sp. FGCU6]